MQFAKTINLKLLYFFFVIIVANGKKNEKVDLKVKKLRSTHSKASDLILVFILDVNPVHLLRLFGFVTALDLIKCLKNRSQN